MKSGKQCKTHLCRQVNLAPTSRLYAFNRLAILANNEARAADRNFDLKPGKSSTTSCARGGLVAERRCLDLSFATG